MKQDKNQKPAKKPENIQDKVDQWIDKAEGFIDDTSEKKHKSETYRKADQSVEKTAKKIFRQAGRWWGKSEHYFKKKHGNTNEKK